MWKLKDNFRFTWWNCWFKEGCSLWIWNACAGCNACYVGETTRHFSTRVREHLVSDTASHIFRTPREFWTLINIVAACVQWTVSTFQITPLPGQLKIKEAMLIQREQLSLNQQLHHVNLKLSFNSHIATFYVHSVVTSVISIFSYL